MDHANLPSRRSFLGGGAALGLGASLPLPVLAQANLAQAWPTKPVRVLVPFGAGGIADITVRIVAERLGDKLGQRFVIENQPSPGGINAARAALQGGTDGYSLALFSNGTAVAAGLFKNLRYDPVKEFAPVSALGYFDFVFATGGEGRFKTLGDLLAEARAKPGALNIGTIASGSTQNLSGELFKTSANIDARIVPYRTTPDVILAAMRGDVDLIVDSYASMKSNLEDGKLRTLATSSINRSVSLPNAPTVAEAGVPGFDVTSWNAIFAPAGTPQPIIDALNKAILDVLAMPETKKQLLDLGIEAKGSTPAELGDKLKADIAKWTAIIDKSGIEKQ
jgi:tripartite-type tricarboxylate transporter receptor subunit TctC